ncbi:hypothetical protein PMAYCL1PPCAC_01681 [Pristionchus mayeri]|uniref:DUF3106 domain-containing protein n=1 Tax=Pristionchus mayeri TaxID=1317129 RepID=A0AAN4Z0A5_9BILA|nr:hypothetical protein PMAYCL1PPCAC_01681 [Pristionchus mayeri]
MNKLLLASLLLLGLVAFSSAQGMPRLTKGQMNQLKALFPKMSNETQVNVLKIRSIFFAKGKSEPQKRQEIRALYDSLRGTQKTEMDQLAAIIFPNGIPKSR